ncbi:CGNR zinc finger domain-containing protein [Mycobacterium sp. DBP42]|uniref:CGNR zinc finger domain-containing protein n=1 Tax=Mycobacterium sp. DBP42 TaxID=2545267 RepID=UPI002016E170|nr:CGNR zinc finger domain-containing protein [Mycobacterium sp. DBP42]
MALMEVGRHDEVLLVDLLNTTPVVDGRQRDVLADPLQARAWLLKHDVAEAELAELVGARNVLQAVVRGTETATVLEPFLEEAVLRAHATQHGLNWELDADGARRGALRAILAWDALRATSPGRLRACANPDCRLFLMDRSKPNTARWCSMATCGNRMKARRHHQRARTAKTDEQS